ncbi:hypothetical protein ACIQVK_19530 [Streptomyces sp. NPDC090493]
MTSKHATGQSAPRTTVSAHHTYFQAELARMQDLGAAGLSG